MTSYDDVLRSLNQLISLVGGRAGAIATNHLASNPLERIGDLISMASRDLTDAATTGDQHSMKQAQRKLESLGSLRVLAVVLTQESDSRAPR
jgi:hypothetical protein